MPLVGDILPQGSARNITLFQNGDRQIVDLYQSLLGLDAGVDPLVVNNARLHVGDQGGTVAVAGFVGRPAIFELAAGQTEISSQELFRLANIRLMAPGTKLDLLRFNDQGVPVSEPIAFGKDQMVQAGQAIQIQFVQTRSQSDVKVFGAVEKPFSLNVVNPLPIAELLRNGAALTSDVYMDFALIAGNRSENGADRTINLTKALQFPDRFLIQPGETLIILTLNQYQTLLKQSLTEPERPNFPIAHLCRAGRGIFEMAGGWPLWRPARVKQLPISLEPNFRFRKISIMTLACSLIQKPWRKNPRLFCFQRR